LIAQIDKTYLKLGIKKLYVRLISYFLFEGRPIGTKGQWFNYLTIPFLRMLSMLPSHYTSRAPILILGMGRSGTTLLGISLSAHSKVSYLNEPKALWYIAYKNDDVIGSYSDSPGEFIYKLSNDALEQLHNRVRRIYAHYLTMTFGYRVVDKYPEMLFRVSELLKIFPDAKFVFAMRNGNDVVRSVAKFSPQMTFVKGERTENWWGLNDRKWNLFVNQVVCLEADFQGKNDLLNAIRNDIDRAALEWILASRHLKRLLLQFPKKIHIFRYEDFLVNHKKSFSDLLEFCNLEKEKPLFDFIQKNLKEGDDKKKVHTEVVKLNALIVEAFLAEMKNNDYKV